MSSSPVSWFMLNVDLGLLAAVLLVFGLCCVMYLIRK